MDRRFFAIGDIHGCYDQFRLLVEERIGITKADRIVLLGDYIDRGYQSREVTDYILELKAKGFDIIPLIGNHESMMLDALSNERYLSNWYMNGGYVTLLSFGIEGVDELDSKYVNFFKSLPFYYSEDKYIFVHAGFNDDIDNPFSDTYQMIWSRKETYSNPVFSGRIIIHGHTPVPLSICEDMAKSGERFINIDTGCVYGEWEGYGHLTAIEVYTRNIISV